MTWNTLHPSPSRAGAGGLRLRGGGHFDELLGLRTLVETENACALPGCTIKYDSFVPILRRAMSRGYVKDHHGFYVLNGLRNGFDVGGCREALRGRRVFRNYKSAYLGRESVTAAVDARVAAGKTIRIGKWSEVVSELNALVEHYFVFPMGAVPKPHDPSTLRPTSDHSKTGFNEHTILGILKHSLDAYNLVCWFLKRGFLMYVSDVQDAFLLIPLAPWVWFFMLFRWFSDSDSETDDCLLAHLFGDFGTRGMPGTFKIFLVDVVVNMARSEMVFTLPLVIYVDDGALIGPDESETNAEMQALQHFTSEYTGVVWKLSKDKPAATSQHYIGFVWNSRDFTLCLEEKKILRYLVDLSNAST